VPKCFQSLLLLYGIAGIQAELWTEVVRKPEHAEYMLFPRLLAVAERAWHHAAWEDGPPDVTSEAQEVDWASFAALVGYQELRRLDVMDVQYRVSPPGARFIHLIININLFQ